MDFESELDLSDAVQELAKQVDQLRRRVDRLEHVVSDNDLDFDLDEPED